MIGPVLVLYSWVRYHVYSACYFSVLASYY